MTEPTKRQIVLTTSSRVPGKEVSEVLGIVRGNTIRARHVGRDLLAAIRGLVGGEIAEYTKLMGESREQALDRLSEEANAIGADAVVDVRIATSMIMQHAAEILVYGTAVKLR